MENIVNQPITLVKVKILERDNGPDACRFSYRVDGDSKLYFSYSKSYGITPILGRILAEYDAGDGMTVAEGIRFKIVLVPGKNGKSGYGLANVAE